MARQRAVPIRGIERVRPVVRRGSDQTFVEVTLHTDSGDVTLEFNQTAFLDLIDKNHQALITMFPDLDKQTAMRYQLYMGMEN